MKELLAAIVVIVITGAAAAAWVRSDQIMMHSNMVPDDYMCVYSKSAETFECGDEDYMRMFRWLTGQ